MFRTRLAPINHNTFLEATFRLSWVEVRSLVRAVLMDWGGTLMRSFDYPGPMVTWPRVALVRGADTALQELHGGYTLAVATNALDSGAMKVREALELVDIARYFQHILTARELGVSDSYANDIAGAHRAGLFTVWYTAGARSDTASQCCCDCSIADLSQLPGAIAQLEK